MLVGGEGLDVILDPERLAALDRPLGCCLERLEVDVAPQSEIHPRALAAHHQVVALVLGVRPAKYPGHVVVARVAMDREVATVDGVQVIEADRKRRPERPMDLGSQDWLGQEIDDELEGDLDRSIAVADEDPRFR